MKELANQKKITVRFIVNPFSGKRTHSDISEIIRSKIEKDKFEFEICVTHSAGHAQQLSREAVEKGTHIIVAIGGDGTINEVASQMINSEAVFAIIPTGSGNGLARHLGIPISVHKAVRLINETNITSIDTATINRKPFVSIAGIGFDALVARKFDKNEKRGFLTYLQIIIKEYQNYEPKTYKLHFKNDRQLNAKAFFISFANSNQFGYNTSIAPNAKLDDGKLDVCIVKKPRIFELPIVAALLLFKKIHKSRLVKIIRAGRLVVEGNDLSVNLDGEAITLKEKLTIEVKPLSLKIIIPKK